MEYAAVIFDLFGTLVDNFSLPEYEGVLTRMASVCSLPCKEFVHLWHTTFNERATGIFPSIDGNIQYICRRLKISPEHDRIKLAVRIRFEFTRRSLRPRDDAVETLTQLRAKGHKIGLISDCTAEVPALWQDTPFASVIDVAVFSCSVGVKKPDPRIYNLTCERLAVTPRQCLYVGDGSSNELTGASRVGMHSVLIRVPHEAGYGAHRIDGEDWHGVAVSALKDVLALVD